MNTARSSVCSCLYALLAAAALAAFAAPARAEQCFARRVLCGNTSTAYTDHFGYVWAADRAYAGNPDPYPWGYTAAASSSIFSAFQRIENSHEWPLYLNERWGSAPTPAYRFDLPGPGTYYVKLLLAENYFGVSERNVPNDGIGARVFNVRINGTLVLDHFDILACTGGRAARALVQTFPVTIGPTPPFTIEIATEAVVENPKLNAIEVADRPTLTDAMDHYSVASPSGAEAFRLNCGGTRSVDADGTLWMADEAWAQCQRWGFTGGADRANTQTAWTTPEAHRLATWRAGGTNWTYRFRVPNGQYAVRLIFAENEFNAAGQRVFDVSLNGETVADDLDVFARVGSGVGHGVERTINVSDEELVIGFPQVLAGEAMINAVEVRALNVTTAAFVDFVERRTLEYFTNSSGPFRTVNSANGLVVDRQTQFEDTPWRAPCSVAGLGFGLTALCIGQARGWISRAEAEAKLTTALTFLRNAAPYVDGSEPGLTHKEGFFYHMVQMVTGRRDGDSELSSIDSSLMFAGVLTAGQAFPATTVAALAAQVLDRVNWPWFVNGQPDGYVAMEWKPSADPAGTFAGEWSCYNEGALLNLVGLSSATHPLSPSCWFRMYRYWWTTNGVTYMGEAGPWGPLGLFTHMYPQCYADLRGTADAKCNYYLNNTLATQDNRNFCSLQAGGYATYAEGGWGLSACDSPQGGYGYLPYRPWAGGHDGTVNPPIVAAAAAFSPDLAIPELRRIFFQYKHFIWGRYGLADAYNLNAPRTLSNTPSGMGWVAADAIGLDHGCMLAGLENYRTGYVWDLFSSAPAVQATLARLGFGDPTLDDLDTDHSHADAPDQRDARWWVSNPAVYALETVSGVRGNSTSALHVTFQKPAGEEWAFVCAGDLDGPANLSYWLGRDRLTLQASGRVKLLFKFKDAYSRESEDSPVFTVDSPAGWQDLTWELSAGMWGECDPRQVRELLVFAEPGAQGSGDFYLDRLRAAAVEPVTTPTATATAVATPALTPTPDLRFLAVSEGVLVYPNPARDRATFLCAVLDAPQITVDIDIYNPQGERVARLTGVGAGAPGTLVRLEWDCSRTAPGVYFYRWTSRDASGQVERSRVRKLAVLR